MLSEKAVFVFSEEENEHYAENLARFKIVIRKYENLRNKGIEWILEDFIFAYCWVW